MYSMGTQSFVEPHLWVAVELLNSHTVFPKRWNRHPTVTTQFLKEWSTTEEGAELCLYKMHKYRGWETKVSYRPRQSFQIAFSAFAPEDIRAIREG